jgi:Na+-driven multidrug efflux pump
MARRQQCHVVHTLDPSYSKHITRYGMSMEENPPSTSSFDAKDHTLNDFSMEEFSLDTSESADQSTTTTITSKRALLSFAIPALGIYLTNPLLSNMDNAFVGQTIGTTGLAALSPATICIDQMLYLFNFLSRATTGLVARAYDDDTDDDHNTPPSPQPRPMLDGGEPGNTSAAREAASARTCSTKHHFVCVLYVVRDDVPCGSLDHFLFFCYFYTWTHRRCSLGTQICHPYTGNIALAVSLMCGVGITIFYILCTPLMLDALRVNPVLRPAASSYIYWRGAIAWAALAQSVCLSVLMATRDAVTPLKIITLAAMANIIGDAMFCVWPFRLGCGGAAAATSMATLFSCTFMIQALADKNILPTIRIPTKKEFLGLLEFTGPLLAVTITRLGSYIAMQRCAMKLGVEALAGYQLSINLLMFFVLFGEPLSQLSQTKLPSLLDRGDGPSVRATFQSILTIAAYTSIGIGAVTYAMAFYGSAIITSDRAVQHIARLAAPVLSLNVATAIFANAVDGAFLASKDFGFLTAIGAAMLLVQLYLLTLCTSVGDIFGTFTIRLATYTVVALTRIALGYGGVGRVIWKGYRKVSIRINGAQSR